MKRAQVVGISIAGAAGLMAFFLMKGIVNRKPEIQREQVLVNATEVLIAKADIGLGQITDQNQFRWQVWPKDAVSPGYITKANGADMMKDLSGAVARAPIMAGEPITQSKVIKAGQGGVLAAILPAGMRAISTKIKEETAAGRLILPNDHVDVIVISRTRGRSSGEQHVSEVLFRNVRVLAIGQQIESKEGKKAAEGAANTATLELTPKQAEELALANSRGEISLSLRSIADLIADGKGPSSGKESKKEGGNAIQVLRYGVRSHAYGVN